MFTVDCAFCDSPIASASIDLHECENYEDVYFQQDLEFEQMRGNRFHYGATSIASAEAFLKANPEFIENSIERDVRSYQKIATGLTIEQRVYLTPDYLETTTGLPVTYDLSEELSERELEWEGIYQNREFDTVLQGVASWKDVEVSRCTSAFHYWKSDRKVNLMPEGYFPNVKLKNGTFLQMVGESTYVQSYEALDFEKANVMRAELRDVNNYAVSLLDCFDFSELSSYGSSLIIDPDITEKFQYKVFNAYVGRDEKMHIGLLEFDRLTNEVGQEVISVTCKRSGCYYRHNALTILADCTRVQQEDFITACIRHGNNHGPDFIVKRSDFTYIHAQNCDTLHCTEQCKKDHVHVYNCNANWPRLDVNALDASDLDAVYGYLIHHRKFCHTDSCRCTHYYHMLSAVVTNNYERIAA